MVPISLPDPTLMRMNNAMEQQYASEQRGYIGASSIGAACERRIWNQFHWVNAEKMTAKSLKAIADGHHSEELMASRLRLVDGISLHTHQESGEQFQCCRKRPRRARNRVPFRRLRHPRRP